jgi:nucleotide-binding universal stress UspA family protein
MSTGVVVGYDGSDCAKVALGAATEIAKQYGEKLIIAFGYELNKVTGEIGDYHHALQELATTRLKEGAALVGDEGCADDRRRHTRGEPAPWGVARLDATQARAPVDATGAGRPARRRLRTSEKTEDPGGSDKRPVARGGDSRPALRQQRE